MVPFVYRCPNTGVQLQGWTADDGVENGKEIYEGEHCPACNEISFRQSKDKQGPWFR
jgi:hypothetical protein